MNCKPDVFNILIKNNQDIKTKHKKSKRKQESRNNIKTGC